MADIEYNVKSFIMRFKEFTMNFYEVLLLVFLNSSYSLFITRILRRYSLFCFFDFTVNGLMKLEN